MSSSSNNLDTVVCPTEKIVALPHNACVPYGWSRQYKSLRGENKRDWFTPHFYYCLPLTIANQYGFVVPSAHEFTVEWNGNIGIQDLNIDIIDRDMSVGQHINSHFGSGIITVQNSFILRTEPGVNLMTMNPPNYFIDGISHMNGVIETDNLRRDFTFNLKVTRPNFKIHIKKGDWIGCFMPIPRYFADKFDMIDAKQVMTADQIAVEQKCSDDFGLERQTRDLAKPHGAGRRYFKGTDVYDNKFPDHQRKVERHPE